MSITKAKALKEMRATAKNVGLTFKQMNVKLNGAYLWQFVDRKTGDKVFWNCTFWSAYENCQNGYISSYDSKTGAIGLGF